MSFGSHNKNLPKGAWRKFINVLLQKMSVLRKIKSENGEKSKWSMHRVLSYHWEFFLMQFLFFWFQVYKFPVFPLTWLCYKGRELFGLVTYLDLRVWAGSLPLVETMCPWGDDSIPPMSQLAICRILVFSCCIPAPHNWSTAPGVMLLPHVGTTAPRKWHLSLVSSSRHGSPLGFSLAVSSTLEKQSSCWLGDWVQFPRPGASALLGNHWSPSWDGPAFPGSATAFWPPAAPSSPVFWGFQPHCRDDSAACEAVSKPWQFTAQCKPALASIYLHMTAKNGASSDGSQSPESPPH